MKRNELQKALSQLRAQGNELQVSLNGKGSSRNALQAEYDRIIALAEGFTTLPTGLERANLMSELSDEMARRGPLLLAAKRNRYRAIAASRPFMV